MTPHKHAALIKAWADGAEIEMKNGEEWMQVNPNWSEFNKYRIKPEPKPDIVVLRQVAWVESVTSSYFTTYTDNFNVKFTFDGETGKLKSAEVL